LTPDYPIDIENAHQAIITDIEHAKIGDKVFFFTSSMDHTIKAWVMTPDNKKLEPFSEKKIAFPVLSLILA